MIPSVLEQPELPAVVRSLQEEFTPRDDFESPIFVFASGVRSGSTLLQRLIASDTSVFMWGEPYETGAIVQSMAQTLFAIKDRTRAGFSDALSFSDEDRVKRWTAVLQPALKQVWRSHRCFWDTFFSIGGRRQSTWGVKWVHLRLEFFDYFKWIYPRSKAVTLVRDPRECLASYLGGDLSIGLEGEKSVVERDRFGKDAWPVLHGKYYLSSTENFMACWNTLVDSMQLCEGREDVLSLSYEFLVNSPKRAAEELGWFLDSSCLDSSVITSSPVGGSLNKVPLSLFKRQLVESLAGSRLERLGYK